MSDHEIHSPLHSFDSLPQFSVRERTGHKGTYGTVLGIGGSRGMAGSIAMAGKAALLGGAGLVRLAIPHSVSGVVAGFYPEITTIPCPEDRKGKFSLAALDLWVKQAEQASCVMMGPGMGRSAALDSMIVSFLRCVTCPIVIDADALNALASWGDGGNHAEKAVFSSFSQSLILTPHDGEFARLRKKPTETELSERIRAAVEFSQRHSVTLVLKGHPTIVAASGNTVTNPTGNPGMATGGSGDVLTGLMAALLAQKFSPWDAARLGVYLHGLAGDLAANQVGEISVTATSILQFLPAAIRQHSDRIRAEPSEFECL